jgi:hypothetical protein
MFRLLTGRLSISHKQLVGGSTESDWTRHVPRDDQARIRPGGLDP